ncbi:MAG: DUF2752 domain-containing protein [Aureliella sp.]
MWLPGVKTELAENAPAVNVAAANAVAANAAAAYVAAEPAKPWLGNSDAIAAVWLVGSLLCLTLAASMAVGESRRVYLLGWSSPLPETCLTYSRFGVDCPGCGLTRTFVHMAHGQFAEAWRLSPVGCFMFAFACLQIPPAVAQLLFRARSRWVEDWGRWNDWGTAGLMAALVMQWLVRIGERMLT